VTIVLKSGNLNLLEPSGPVQACDGIAFYIMDCILSRFMHLSVTKSTTYENYAASHQIMQTITNLKLTTYIAVGTSQLPLTHLQHVPAHLVHYHGLQYDISGRMEGLQIRLHDTLHIIVKGKAIPLEAWRDPEGFRSLGLPDFKTIGA
jgi:hypothetical protein